MEFLFYGIQCLEVSWTSFNKLIKKKIFSPYLWCSWSGPPCYCNIIVQLGCLTFVLICVYHFHRFLGMSPSLGIFSCEFAVIHMLWIMITRLSSHVFCFPSPKSNDWWFSFPYDSCLSVDPKAFRRVTALSFSDFLLISHWRDMPLNFFLCMCFIKG